MTPDESWRQDLTSTVTTVTEGRQQVQKRISTVQWVNNPKHTVSFQQQQQQKLKIKEFPTDFLNSRAEKQAKRCVYLVWV